MILPRKKNLAERAGLGVDSISGRVLKVCCFPSANLPGNYKGDCYTIVSANGIAHGDAISAIAVNSKRRRIYWDELKGTGVIVCPSQSWRRTCFYWGGRGGGRCVPGSAFARS